MHASVRNMLKISKAINGELTEQDEMLGQLKNDLDKTHDGIERTEQRTEAHLSKSKRCSIQ